MSDQSTAQASSTKGYSPASLGGLSPDLKRMILDTLDKRPALKEDATGHRAPDFRSCMWINKDWRETVESYQNTMAFRKKEPLIITDLTSMLLGYPASEAEVIEGDTVKTIFDRSGVAERLPHSRLGTAEEWILPVPRFSHCDRDRWYQQTLQSLEWLKDHAASGLYKLDSIILNDELPFEAATKTLLTCELEGERLWLLFYRNDLAYSMTRFANCFPIDDVPTVHMDRAILEDLPEIPLKAVFKESQNPPGALKEDIRQMDQPFDHNVEFNMSDCGSDWSKLHSYIKDLCTYQGKVMELSTAVEASTTRLHFAVEPGDSGTTSRLRDLQSSLRRIALQWKVENGSKNNIEMSFGVEPVSEGYLRLDHHKAYKFDAGRNSYKIGSSLRDLYGHEEPHWDSYRGDLRYRSEDTMDEEEEEWPGEPSEELSHEIDEEAQ